MRLNSSDDLLEVIRGYFGLKEVFLKDIFGDLCNGKTKRICLVNMNEGGILFLNLGGNVDKASQGDSLI